jgi:uncharacterized protein YgbK (DUF1537 family)
MIRMGVVADDITGSNDIGIMFAKAGYRTRVYNFEKPGDFLGQYQSSEIPEIAILNTNSRLDDGQTAYQKVYDATRELKNAECEQFHNKTCSVFRGNIGAEFDAMLDALEKSFAVVVLGFPKNGRTTINGVHHVRGVPLQESEFRNDPVHPMRESNLVDILQKQTERRVGLITHEIVSRGAVAIRQALNVARTNLNYVILDVVDQQALAMIAEAVADEAVICGSSAIAEELPTVWNDALPETGPLQLSRHDVLGILCAAGSLMPQTAAQIAHMRQQGAAIITLDTLALFDQDRDALVADYTSKIVQAMMAGRDVVFHSANEPEQVAATRRRAQERGYPPNQAARLVSSTIAEVVACALERTGQNRLLIAGGETSDAVCRRLNVNSLQIHEEIQPGLPSCFSLTDPPLLLVLKSGSFGSPDFFEQALNHLRTA